MNKLYSVTGAARIAQAPTIQSTDIIFSDVTDNSLTISFTRGNGLNTLLMCKAGGAVDSVPINNTTYTPSTIFGIGSQVGIGNYVLSYSASSIVSITGLSPSTTYHFRAFDFNGAEGDEKYNITTATGNPNNQTTSAVTVAPTDQTTDLSFLGDRQVNWVRGNGSFILVLAREGGAVNANPTDGVSYIASNNYGDGDEIGTGNYVVYRGTADSFEFNPESLEYSTLYGIRAYEFNGANGSEKYNITTDTGNPLSHTTIDVENWYQYHDTPLFPRRDATAWPDGRASNQNYPICHFENDDYYFVTSISEGDDGQDRTIRMRKSKTDGLPITLGWAYDSPPDALGDPPALIDGVNRQFAHWSSGTTYSIGNKVWNVPNSPNVYRSLTNGNIGNPPTSSPTNWVVDNTWDNYQCWAMWEVNLGGGNRRLYYSANAGSAQRYSIGFMESSDDGETWTRYAGNPVITQGSGKAYYYSHGMKDGSDWYLFAQNYNAGQLVENHLYVGEIHHSTDGISWTKISTGDIFAGRGLWGAIDVSQPWKDGSRYYAYISYHDTGNDGGFRADPSGNFTTIPVGKHIALISWSDWNNFQDFIFERIIFTTSQDVDIDARTWCAPIIVGSEKYVWSMQFQYRCQTLLAGISQNEPFNNGKILSTEQIMDQGYQWVGNEAYPEYVDRLIIPHQSKLNDTIGSSPVQPIERLSGRTLDIVGTPVVGRLRSIFPNNAGFVEDNEPLTYSNYLAVKVQIARNSLSSTYGICGMDTNVGGGTRGWSMWKSGLTTIDFRIQGTGGLYKQWRLNFVDFVTGNSSQLVYPGFVFRNGDLKICYDYTSDVEGDNPSKITKVHNDSFTTIQQTDEPIRVGAIYPTTTDPLYSQDIVGPVAILVGDTHATEANWLRMEII